VETREEPPAAPSSSAQPRDSQSAPSAEGGRSSWGCIGLVLTVLTAGLGGVAWAVRSCAESAKPTKPKLNLANLATGPFEFGWNELDAPPIVGSYTSFDAVANVEWAKRIATAWKADAILYRFGAEGVTRAGTVDIEVTPDASVMYRFMSPKCLSDYKSSTALVDPETKCDFYITVKSKERTPRVEVLPSKSSGLETELQDPVCTLGQAFAALEKAEKLPPRPIYKADIYVFSSTNRPYKAKWTFVTVISGQASIPSVDSTTCAIDS
jgi:hypothetical protein